MEWDIRKEGLILTLFPVWCFTRTLPWKNNSLYFYSLACCSLCVWLWCMVGSVWKRNNIEQMSRNFHHLVNGALGLQHLWSHQCADIHDVADTTIKRHLIIYLFVGLFIDCSTVRGHWSALRKVYLQKYTSLIKSSLSKHDFITTTPQHIHIIMIVWLCWQRYFKIPSCHPHTHFRQPINCQCCKIVKSFLTQCLWWDSMVGS